MQKHSLLFLNIVFFRFLKMFSSDAYIIVLPVIAIAIDANRQHLQRLITVFLLGLALALFLAGPLSIKYGKRFLVLRLLPLFILGTLVAGFSNNIWSLTSGIFMIGFGIGATPSLARALVFDQYKNTGKTALIFTIAASIFAWAPVISMVFGGHIAELIGWHFVFFFLALFGLGAFITAFFLFKEPARTSTDNFSFKKLKEEYCQILSKKSFTCGLIGWGLILSGIYIYYCAGFFIYQHTMHIRPTTIAYLIFFICISSIAGKYLGVWLEKITNVKYTVIAGGAICVISSFMMLFFNYKVQPAILNTLSPMVGYVLGMSIMTPVFAVYLMNELPKSSGLVSTLTTMTFAIIGAIASFLISLFHIRNAEPMAVILLIISSAGLLLIFVTFNSGKKHGVQVHK